MPSLSFFAPEEDLVVLDAWTFCRAWAVALCSQVQGGHDWLLEIDPGDGVSLCCQRCHAVTDDIYPDGIDLLTGDFEVYPGYVLGLRAGAVDVNRTWRDGLHTYGWRGPVAVRLVVEKYTSMDWIGTEYDVWIEVDPRDDA